MNRYICLNKITGVKTDEPGECKYKIPINDWIKKKYSVDYVDTITEPGVEKKISENSGS